MSALTHYSVQRLSPSDVPLMNALLSVFGKAFEEPRTYEGALPGAAYLEGLLAKRHFIALAALEDGAVIGGLRPMSLRSSSRSAAKSTSMILRLRKLIGAEALPRR